MRYSLLALTLPALVGLSLLHGAEEVAGLKLLYEGPVPKEIDCGRIAPLADRLAGDDSQSWEAAEAALAAEGPWVALYLQRRAEETAEPAAKARLVKARDRACADSPVTARKIADLAEALMAVNANLEDPAGIPDLLRRRGLAKFFHLCFIRTSYADLRGGLFTPSVDLLAAREIYRAAAGMYERLAKGTSDPKRAAELLAEGESCRNKAKKAGSSLKESD